MMGILAAQIVFMPGQMKVHTWPKRPKCVSVEKTADVMQGVMALHPANLVLSCAVGLAVNSLLQISRMLNQTHFRFFFFFFVHLKPR